MSMTVDERILGYLLSEKSLTLKVLDQVPQEYLKSEYQDFFSLIKRCTKKYNETPTVRMVKEDPEWREDFETIYFESQAYQDKEDYNSTDFSLDLEILKNRYNTRVLLKVGREIFQNNYDGRSEFADLTEANKLLRKALADIDRINSKRVYKEGTLRATAAEALEDYRRIRDNPELAQGIHLGLREFDRITNGLQPAELVLIGGESSAGKSALAMNMAVNAWKGSNPYPEDLSWVMARDYAENGVNVMYFTIEMPYKPLRRRVGACLAGVPLYGIRDGTLTDEEEMKYEAALKFQEFYSKEFHIVDIPRGCTVSQIESKYMEMLYQFQPELIVVDYISLMELEGEQSQDWLKIGKLAELLHEFCRTYDIPCITPVQLTRPKPGHGGTPLPDQHRVGRSIMLPQNCNILLNIDTRPDEGDQPDMVINIGKMRDGEKGAFTLIKRLDIMRIYDDVPGWTTSSYTPTNVDEGDTNGD